MSTAWSRITSYNVCYTKLLRAAAGVGTLGFIDFDVVDLSNLQRQIMHGESTVGKLKVDSAKGRIADLNASVNVVTYNERLTAENAMQIFKDYDVIIRNNSA